MNAISQAVANNQQTIGTWSEIVKGVMSGAVTVISFAASAIFERFQMIAEGIKFATFGLVDFAGMAGSVYGKYQSRAASSLSQQSQVDAAEKAAKAEFMISGGRIGSVLLDETAGGGGGGKLSKAAKTPKFTEKSFQMSSQAKALIEAAKRLGISPLDLATIIGYETAGTFSTSIKGGKGGNYQGLIQFGKEERQKYGVSGQQTFEQQLLNSVVPYLKDRFASVGRTTTGATLTDVYKTINGGNPAVGNVSDDGGKTRISDHVAKMIREQMPAALKRFFGGKKSNLGGDFEFSQISQITDQFMGFGDALKGIGAIAELTPLKQLSTFLNQAPAEDVDKLASSVNMTADALRKLVADELDLGKQTAKVTTLDDAFKLLGGQTVPTLAAAVVDVNTELTAMSELSETGIVEPAIKAKERWEDFFGTFRTGIEEMQGTLPSINASIGENLLTALSSIGDVFANAVTRWDGTAKGFFKSIATGFAQMAQQIIAEMIKIAIMRLVLNLVGLFAGGASAGPSAAGGIGGGAAPPMIGHGGGFSSGGFTGFGSSNAIAGLVHKNEFVMPAKAVKKFGIGFMEGLRSLQNPPMAFAGGGNSATYNNQRSHTFNINATGGTQAQNQQSTLIM